MMVKNFETVAQSNWSPFVRERTMTARCLCVGGLALAMVALHVSFWLVYPEAQPIDVSMIGAVVFIITVRDQYAYNFTGLEYTCT